MTEFLNVLLEDVHLVSDEFRKSLKSLVLAEGGIQKEPLAFEEPWSTTWFPNLKHVCLDLSDDSRTLALLARLDPIQPTHLPIGLVRDRVVRTAQDFPSWSEDRPLNRWQMHLHEEGKFDADVKGGEGPIKEDLLGIWKFVTSFPDLQRLELPNAWQASKFLHDVRTAGYQYFANPNEGLANPKQVVLTCSAPVEGQDEPETPRKHKLAVDHEIENLRTRILENNLHGSRYGSEVQRLRIDNIDPRVFVVDTINDAPVGMQKLRVLNLNSLPRHGKKIPQWLWTLQNMQEYFETAGIPFPGDLTDAEVRIIKDVAKQALSALRIIYKNHPVWLVHVGDVTESKAGRSSVRRIVPMLEAMRSPSVLAIMLKELNTADREFVMRAEATLPLDVTEELKRAGNSMVLTG